MANNRMYIICTRCVMEDKEDSGFYLGKYFPREGWYIHVTPDFQEAYNKFLEDHSHEEARSLFGYDPEHGYPFMLHFEAGDRYQDQVLIHIGEALSKEKDADNGASDQTSTLA